MTKFSAKYTIVKINNNGPLFIFYYIIIIMRSLMINPLTSRPGCMPGSRYTGVRVLFFVI